MDGSGVKALPTKPACCQKMYVRLPVCLPVCFVFQVKAKVPPPVAPISRLHCLSVEADSDHMPKVSADLFQAEVRYLVLSTFSSESDRHVFLRYVAHG